MHLTIFVFEKKYQQQFQLLHSQNACQNIITIFVFEKGGRYTHRKYSKQKKHTHKTLIRIQIITIFVEFETETGIRKNKLFCIKY